VSTPFDLHVIVVIIILPTSTWRWTLWWRATRTDASRTMVHVVAFLLAMLDPTEEFVLDVVIGDVKTSTAKSHQCPAFSDQRKNSHIAMVSIVLPGHVRLATSLDTLWRYIGTDSASRSGEVDTPVSAILVQVARAKNAALCDIECLTVIAILQSVYGGIG
jgi:hypothetical protein